MATVHSPEKTLEYHKPHRLQSGKTLAALALLLVAVAVGSAAIGSYPISLHDWWSLLTTPSAGGTAEIVLLQIRLPRLLACILVGSGLALAGSSYQGLFNNPMVSPDILGASAGAGLGAAAGILLVEEAGGRVTDFAGNHFLLDSREILASNGLIHEELMGFFADMFAGRNLSPIPTPKEFAAHRAARAAKAL